MLEDIIPNPDNNPSGELLELTDRFVNLEGSRVEVIQQMVEKCKQENVDPEKIREIIETKLRARGLSDRTIRRAIPDEFKDKKMQEVRSHRIEYVRKEPEPEESQPEPVTETIQPPEPEPTPPIQSVQQPPLQKPQPDYRFVKYGNVQEAFEQIKFALGQVMDKQRQCKMGLLIFYM